jgi:hypothetical protein
VEPAAAPSPILKDPKERFPALVRAADVLLAVTTDVAA